MECFYSACAGFLDWISDDEQTRELSVNADEHDALSLGSVAVSLFFQRCWIGACVAHERFITESDGTALDGAGHALPRV